MLAIVRTAVNAFRRPTSATGSLLQPIMLVCMSIGLSTLMVLKVIPAFSEVGYGDGFATVMTLYGVFMAGIILLVVLASPSAWREVSAHQCLNDEAGFNVVGKRERERMDRLDAAYERLKARRRRVLSAR